MEVIGQVWQWAVAKFGEHIAAGIAGALLSGLFVILLGVLRRFAQRVRCFVSSRRRALAAVGRVPSPTGPREGNGVWLSTPILQPENYRTNIQAAKVLVVANNKGGVGKTTLAANIGAYLAQEWKLRVLLIDGDYQGTISQMALPAEQSVPRKGQDSLASKAMSGDLAPGQFVDAAREVASTEGHLCIIPAYYDLAQADNRLLVEWLLRCKKRRRGGLMHAVTDLFLARPLKFQDVRYNLADILHDQAVREAFDLVVIDCPPRLTTGTVQALCSCSHLLVPTILDVPSSSAVIDFCQQVETLKSGGVCPHIALIGVVGTKWRDVASEREAKQKITDAAREANVGVTFLSEATFVPYSNQLVRNADDGIAYLVIGNAADKQKVKDAIHNLAVKVAMSMGLRVPDHVQVDVHRNKQGQ